MSNELKLHVLLAKTEHGASSYKALISDYLKFFKNDQGQFIGVRRTFTPREGVIDQPSKRGNQLVVTTVDEKLTWLEEQAGPYIENALSVEATNASGNAKADLIVDGINLGSFSSLELLRIKSFLESGDLEKMYSTIPVRSDSEVWTKTDEEMYRDREVYEGRVSEGVDKSIMKQEYVLEDVNVINNSAAASRYVPTKSVKDVVIELGDYKIKHFSGEYTHRLRAEILKRRSKLLEAVVAAMKVANETPAVKSQMTFAKLFGYLHRGKI